MSDRRLYQQEYRQRQKEKLRRLKETKPGRYIRDNPDYESIMEAIRMEQTEGGDRA